MTDAEWLYVILAALYASECVFKLRRDAVVFASALGGRWRQKPVHCPASGADWGLVIDNPLPGGFTVVTSDWPISFGAFGALGYVARCHSPQGRMGQSGRWAPYDAFKEASCEGRTILVDGQPLAEAGSERNAEACAQLLAQLQELPADKRAGAIRAALDKTLSVAAVDERIDQLQSATLVSRTAGTALLLTIFGGGAALLWVTEAYYWWPLLPALLVVAHVVAVVGLFRGLRTLELRHVEGMTKHLITAVLSPLASARGPAIMSRHALEGFHPLACAVALLPQRAWSQLARRWLRDLRHPLAPPCEHRDEAARAAEAQYRELVAAALDELLVKFAWDEAVECAAPEPEEPACVAWCPRCLAQFTTPDVGCANCGGLETVAFARQTPRSAARGL